MADVVEPLQAHSGHHHLDVIPVNANIGAEIRGIEISGDMDLELVKAIRAAVQKYKVVFFRGQHRLDDAGQQAFSKLFGELQEPIAKTAGESAAVLELTGGYSTSAWHADMTYLPDPLAFTILRAVEVPQIGGDTMWANAVVAYRDLPAPLKLLADNLRSIQSSDFDWEGAYNAETLAMIAKTMKGGNTYAKPRDIIATEHAVVLLHPETGERSLFVGPDVKRFVGMNNADSRKILEILQSYVTLPENTVRWKWRLGDVAMWENVTTQHRAVPDHGADPRVMRRTAVQGCVLTGIDGRNSRRLNA